MWRGLLPDLQLDSLHVLPITDLRRVDLVLLFLAQLGPQFHLRALQCKLKLVSKVCALSERCALRASGEGRVLFEY